MRGCAGRAAERPAGAAAPGGHRLGEDRERGLLDDVGADVEPARAGDPLERLLGDAGLDAAARAAAPGCGGEPSARRRTPRSRARAFSAGRSNLSSWVRTTTAVAWSGATCANASSGHATISSSALGIRSRVANFARASATIVRQPSSFAPAAERLGSVDGAVDEQPRRRPVDLGEDRAALELEHPAARAADQLVGVRRRARPARRRPSRHPRRRAASRPSALAFDDGEHDGAAAVALELRAAVADLTGGARRRRRSRRRRAGRPPRPPRRRSRSERSFGSPVAKHLLRLLEDVALDAAAGDRAAELAALGDGEARADRARRRAAVRDDRGDDDRLALLLPALDLGEDLLHRCSLPVR